MPSLADLSDKGAQQMLTNFNETQPEKEFRQAANFPECESTMGFSLMAKRHVPMGSLVGNLITKNKIGRLIFGNPAMNKLFPRPTKQVDPKKHEVWLLDNSASQPDGSTAWQATFTAAYFEYDSGENYTEMVSEVARFIGIADDDAARQRIATRLEPFLTTILPDTYATASICGQKQTTKLSPSNSEGIGYDNINLPGQWTDGQTCESTVFGVKHSTPCCTTFATIDGWAVISDIDDTIKITGTGSPTEVVRNTFLEDPVAVPGMPELYKWLQTRLDNPPFWYVSASPYVLYPFLRQFRKQHYPDGPMQLRETTLTNLAGIFMALTAGVQDFKVTAISKIYASFPKRRIICIGDSTQSDPEAYAELYKKHPGWIEGIFIRNVFGEEGGAFEKMGKNSPERFEKAFKGVPREDWHVFTDPKDLYVKVDELMKRKGA